jgi:mono/diheme cytochrome c family protein
MRDERYQILLITLGIVTTALFGVFFYREIFPEYKIYQTDYKELEEFRSTYTGQPVPPFSFGVKQIVLDRGDNGPQTIDRCTSCHVALEFEHFSPTKIAYDDNGKVIEDTDGLPKKIPNKDYVWAKLDAAIKDLQEKGTHPKLLERYEGLKVATIGDHRYDVTKVLRMHPLIGRETRPFELHPVEEYGCTSCHNGNGRGLTTEKAHGPVFDGKYEEEFLGYEPEFLEKDSLNDPKFSTVLNHKPGHELLFQTTPIFVGALIEAKCVQCHNTEDVDITPDVNSLTKTFQFGEELYISQGCYACHRIAGVARGGVGPELTYEGKKYPWFVKESIVWPQADLKTSTMPNFKLDHNELEALTTFLLAQTGKRKHQSDVDYKVAIQKWESGKKSSLEKEVSPEKIIDLDYGMEVFATQGCAACHRLKGFVSDVGFAVEKESKNVDFETLYKEKMWFQKLFPEDLRGSEIVSTIDKNKDEIDAKIKDGVRKNSILEKIEKNHPEVIESFYSNFRFASRAKNHEFQQLAITKGKEIADAAMKEWNDRLHRILMVAIQEYGLGRLIGPRPNWSGVYRSDEWLMEHFKNPANHAARSIMPVFPFDESKFYALTNMLDVLAVKNKNALHEVWKHRGFNPEEVFQILCSQCHGEHLLGNGPVSEWIYPIPKNLRNADFLRNLTKERAYDSIKHGVKGGPMPPWGEIGTGKKIANKTPVLNDEQITELVDWIFSSLPGGTVIRSSEDTPKWNYTPEDVIKDLENEGRTLKGKEENKDALSDLYHFQNKERYYVSLKPSVGTSKGDKQLLGVNDVFDMRPIPGQEVEKQGYYIKKKYYTKQNIEAGRAYYLLNCAACHGNDADGAGNRSVAMDMAKPRMLTNLDWIETRDDLRLIRSIKYGVPGTSMTPWGDQTSSLQRLQLVMYIRSLNEEKELRSNLFTQLYKSFDESKEVIQEARYEDGKKITALTNEIALAQKAKTELEEKSKTTPEDAKEALKAYQHILELEQQLEKIKSSNNIFNELIALVKSEKEKLTDVGLTIINLRGEGLNIEYFNQYLKQLEGRFSFSDNKLLVSLSDEKQQKMTLAQAELNKEIDEKINALEKELVIEKGKISSPEQIEVKKYIELRIKSLTGLKEKLNATLENVKSSLDKEVELVKKYGTVRV